MNKEFDFADIVREVSNKFGKTGIAGTPAPMAIRLPSFILRLLFQNEGLILGKIIHIVGLEATFKSTLALEITKWHIEHGGCGMTLHTESRLNDKVIEGVLGDCSERHVAITCDTLEEWQSILLDAGQRLGHDTKELACFTVDSVMGVSSERTIAEITKDGFASSKFAHEANLIASYLRVFNAKLYDRPHTVCLINHRKFRPNMNNYGPPEKASLGGNEIKFCSSFEIETYASDGSKQVLGPVTSYEVYLKLDKNTFGQEGIQIRVPIRFVNTPDGTKVAFDWFAATTYFLNKFNNVKPVPLASTAKKVAELIPVSVRRGGPKGDLFYSDAIGIPSTGAVSATDFGLALEERQDILTELYKIFGIFRRYIYDSKIPYSDNVIEAGKFYSTLKQSSNEILPPDEGQDSE